MIDSIGSVGANTPSAGRAVIEAAAKGFYGLQTKPSKGKSILGGDSVKVTDGELNTLAGILEKTKPRARRHAELHNPTPGTRPPSDPRPATSDPLTVTP